MEGIKIMTIKELYDAAVANACKNYEVKLPFGDDNNEDEEVVLYY